MLHRMTTKNHWESVYEPKSADAVSWYAPHLNDSRVEQHTAPWGTHQQFVYCFCKRVPSKQAPRSPRRQRRVGFAQHGSAQAKCVAL